MASLDGLDVSDLIDRGREALWLEYKQSAPWDELKLKVSKAALAFANTRDGGYLVIGMRDLGNDHYEATGMTAEHLGTYGLDDVQAQVNRYADPDVSLDCAVREHNGKRFYVIAVDEFRDVPVVCTKGVDGELRQAAIYARRLAPISSAPIDNQGDMRTLLDLATDRALGREIQRLRSAGLWHSEPVAVETDSERFATQRGDI